jgi:hypothetical protein
MPMSWFLHLHVIRLFNLYLILVFLITTYARLRDYVKIVGMVRRAPGRWPRLFQLVKQHGHIFLTWKSFYPLLSSGGLLVTQSILTRLVWPFADDFLTIEHLLHNWPTLLFVLPCTAAMIAFDIYWVVTASEIDYVLMEKYFDQAEFWLKSWTAPVVRVFTLGYINPRQMVATEVRNALNDASGMVNSTLWWMAWQAGVRIACGASLWLAYLLAGE